MTSLCDDFTKQRALSSESVKDMDSNDIGAARESLDGAQTALADADTDADAGSVTPDERRLVLYGARQYKKSTDMAQRFLNSGDPSLMPDALDVALDGKRALVLADREIHARYASVGGKIKDLCSLTGAGL